MGKIRVGEAGYTVEMSSSTKTGKMGKTEGVQGQQLGGCGPTPAPRGEKGRTEPNTTQSPLRRAVMETGRRSELCLHKYSITATVYRLNDEL